MDPHRLSDTPCARRRLWPWRCAAALGALVLAACTSPSPWQAPAAAAGDVRTATCPDLAGVYPDAARDSTSCSDKDARACRSLAFHLFSAHVREASGVSNVPTPDDDWPPATHVQIVQEHGDVLRVTAWARVAGAAPRVLATRELDQRRGDFACSSNTLRLKPRVERDFQLWMARRTLKEYLELSAQPGALVAISTRHYDSYVLWVAGGTMRVETSQAVWERLP